MPPVSATYRGPPSGVHVMDTNGKFDIENKPLSSIGLVAGALVAPGYWAAVIVNRVV